MNKTNMDDTQRQLIAQWYANRTTEKITRMEHQPRPLFKHIRNHTALFAELAGIRDQVALSLNPHFQAFHKTPKFCDAAR